jgi:lysine 2,3-aminomutase
MSLMDIDNIRDIRIATKGLMGLPQHFLQDDVRAAFGRMGARANERGVDIAVHTHVNHANSVTPLVRDAAQMVLDSGFRDVRNQGVLLRGVNTTVNELLDLCFTLLDHGKILPYYFYMCDMIPNAEHWRTSVAAVRSAGLHARVRDPAHGVRRPLRGQAMGAHAGRLRPHARDLLLDEELPHGDRVR